MHRCKRIIKHLPAFVMRGALNSDRPVSRGVTGQGAGASRSLRYRAMGVTSQTASR